MDLVTSAQLVKLTGIPSRTIARWVQAGVIAPTSRGKWDLEATLPAIVRHLRTRHESTDAKQRLLEANANLRELQHDQLTATLVPRADVEVGWRQLVGVFRSELLSLPGRLASELAREMHPAEARSVLDLDARRICNRLSAELSAAAARLRGEQKGA